MSLPTAILGAGAIGGVGSLIGGVIGSNAAQNAAQVQAQAAEYAANIQRQEFGRIQKELAPYRQAGARATGAYERLLGIAPGQKGGALGGFLNRPLPQWQPTMAQLARTPGYQFTLQQGELATQNAFAAQGLGSSGAAMKGAEQYATGLASTTYNQQFSNWLQQQQLKLAQRSQIAGNVGGLAGLGESAAAMTGQLGLQAAGNIGSYLTSAAAAQAAGTVGSANAITNALGGVTGAGTNTALLLALNNAGLFAGGNAGAMAPYGSAGSYAGT